MIFDKFFAELCGTFVFLAVIITSVESRNTYDKSQAWLKIGIALSIAILAFGFISGGHFNPAVSIMFFADNKLSLQELAVYIFAQILGALLAYYYFILTKK